MDLRYGEGDKELSGFERNTSSPLKGKQFGTSISSALLPASATLDKLPYVKVASSTPLVKTT